MILIALDLEMNQPSGKIIQIGAVIGNVLTGDILAKFDQFVDPLEPLAPQIITLTGITQQQLDNSCVPLPEAYAKLVTFRNSHKVFINPLTWGGGDSQELRQQLGEQSEPWIFGRRWIDVKTLYQSYRIANYKPVQGGLAKAMTKFGLQFRGQKHNACDDALNTFLFYRHLLKLLNKRD